ncbi:cold shock domain-containing protein [Methylobacterium sp. NEAU K]|uniref:cold shock domain-containing protein n=1 Tax=Methylobacterium sp. NEAU K TaxID=3064946 RepID=UPI002735D975|nr:cold shock domain-containing protein [Methylobacterium sp. NEAU K]MDP4006370.1 cold shock domain-containing protein [Methylobacterium sp. NEAU K]
MQVPAKIAFRHYEPLDQIRAEIDEEVSCLETFSDKITSCHVTVTGPPGRHRNGEAFTVTVHIAMPEHHDIIVDRRHGDTPEHEYALVAIKDAFKEARRQIEDVQRAMRGQTKIHAVEEHGRVTKFLAGENCGFIETDDGREIYFHRTDVLHEGFDRLTIGAEVRFAETEGAKGPQASTVRPIGKHHLV